MFWLAGTSCHSDVLGGVKKIFVWIFYVNFTVKIMLNRNLSYCLLEEISTFVMYSSGSLNHIINALITYLSWKQLSMGAHSPQKLNYTCRHQPARHSIAKVDVRLYRWFPSTLSLQWHPFGLSTKHYHSNLWEKPKTKSIEIVTSADIGSPMKTNAATRTCHHVMTIYTKIKNSLWNDTKNM